MKHTIWSNINLDLEDWRADLEEEYPGYSDDELYEIMCDTNSSYLDDERMNLNKQLDGRILVIANLGMWNGRKQGYKILGTNLNEIFNINPRGFDYAEFYGDGNNIKATEYHHDGTNYYEFRMIREDRNIDHLLNAIYNGEEVRRKKLNYYTKSLYKAVVDVYGWR